MIGRLDQRVTFQTLSRTADGLGGYEEAWVDYSVNPVVWAKVTPGGGSEIIDSDRVEAVAYYTFKVRYRTDVQEADRIVWGGEPYSVRQVRRESGSGLYLEVITERRAPSSGSALSVEATDAPESPVITALRKLAASAIMDAPEQITPQHFKPIPGETVIMNSGGAMAQPGALPMVELIRCLGLAAEFNSNNTQVSLDVPFPGGLVTIKAGNRKLTVGDADREVWYSRPFNQGAVVTAVGTVSHDDKTYGTPLNAVLTPQDPAGTGFRVVATQWSGTAWVTPTKDLNLQWLAVGF